MAVVRDQDFSRPTQDVTKLLGVMIHNERAKQHLTVEVVAGRANVSKDTVRRIEEGCAGCRIGAVLEVAKVVGVQSTRWNEELMGIFLWSINNP